MSGLEALSQDIQSIDSQTLEESTERPSIGSYSEMTERIPHEDRVKIEAKMDSLTEVDRHLDTIQEQLKTGDYTNLHEDAFFYALKGLKDGKVRVNVVTRISDIETLRRQGVEFTVFNPLEKYDTHDALRTFLYKATGKHLHGEALESFIDDMKKMPIEDLFIMSFNPNRQKVKPQLLTVSMATDLKPTISQILESIQKMNVFGRIKDPENPHKYLRFFSSLDLFNLVLEKRFGKDRVIPNPVFGKSTPGQIERNGLTNTRDVAHFYLVPDDQGKNTIVTYDEADGYQCEENDFNQHDRYHAFVTSSIGPESRALSVTVAKLLKAHALERKADLLKDDYSATRSYRWQLVDMDYPQHYKLEWVSRTKMGAIKTAAEKTLRAYKLNPKLPIIRGILQFLPMASDLHTASKFLRGNPGNSSARARHELLVSNTPLKAFETRAALHEMFQFTINQLPKDLQHIEAIEQFEKDSRTSIETVRNQMKTALNSIAIMFLSTEAEQNLKESIANLDIYLKTLDAVFSPD